MSINTIIYTRVSTDEKASQDNSIEHQENKAINYCELKKYNVLKIYKEEYSAKSFERPQWNLLLQFIKSNKGLVNKIVFVKWDRFSTNSYEALGMIKQLKKLNVIAECIEAPLDFEVPDSIVLLGIYLAFP